MSKPDEYLWDGSGPVDPEVARLEGLLSPLRHDRPLDELRLRRRRRRGPWIVGALVAVAAAVALFVLVRDPGSRTAPSTVACGGDAGFRFTAQTGTVACEGASIAHGVLPVGGVLDTGASQAELAIADIGTAQLFEGTRVRLARTEARTRHELHLERGRMHAVVTAPPRMFAVTTPSTSVIDLGCEYTIEIDDAGQGWIAVQGGQVELESANGALVVAPAGTTVRLLAGRRPSLPVTDDASAQVRAAVTDFERGDPEAIERLLAAISAGDVITLVNLVELAPPAQRPQVLTRLAEIIPPPIGVTLAEAAVVPAKLGQWREAVVTLHLGERALRVPPMGTGTK